MTKIIEALAALARATGSSYTTVSVHDDGTASVSLDGNTDIKARQLAAAFGIELTLTGNAALEWLSGRTKVGDVYVTVFGPHHERPQPRGEEATEAIEAACAQAEEALAKAKADGALP